jgi:hypothetical protein
MRKNPLSWRVFCFWPVCQIVGRCLLALVVDKAMVSMTGFEG